MLSLPWAADKGNIPPKIDACFSLALVSYSLAPSSSSYLFICPFSSSCSLTRVFIAPSDGWICPNENNNICKRTSTLGSCKVLLLSNSSHRLHAEQGERGFLIILSLFTVIFHCVVAKTTFTRVCLRLSFSLPTAVDVFLNIQFHFVSHLLSFFPLSSLFSSLFLFLSLLSVLPLWFVI